MAQLICKNAALGYEGKVIADDISFTVNSGDYLCIVGENGSGKSTLIKAILGLNKPISGEIITGDGLNAYEIGYLPQQTAVQRDFPACVKEIVLSGCLNGCRRRPFFSKKEKDKAKEKMEQLGILPLANRCYRELSGGQQQRVLLARALCATKKMLLLDEPVAGLDPKITAELYEIIAKLNKNDGITVIMVTHDMTAAAKYASHILHVAHTPLFYGKKNDYFNTEAGRSYSAINGGDLT